MPKQPVNKKKPDVCGLPKLGTITKLCLSKSSKIPEIFQTTFFILLEINFEMISVLDSLLYLSRNAE